MRRALVLLPVLVLALAALPLGGASAQQATGVIAGTVRAGTAGAPAVDAVSVELITLAADASLTTRETVSSGGRFEFRVPLDASLTHLLSAAYGGVRYFAPEPVVLTAAAPAAEREITVYEPTREPPALRIESTVLTVVELDRVAARLSLIREDVVVNPGDRTYVGDEGGVTLRLPVPDRTLGAQGAATYGGLPAQGALALDGGRLAATTPLRPGRTLVVTSYAVSYDRDGDGYRLRATSPLPAASVRLLVPARFVDRVSPLPGSARREDSEFEGERFLVIAREGSSVPGQGAAADLRGLSGRQPANPLTETRGAALASALALGGLAGGFFLFRALARRTAGGGGGP